MKITNWLCKGKTVVFESDAYERDMVAALTQSGKSHSFIQSKVREYRIKEAKYIDTLPEVHHG